MLDREEYIEQAYFFRTLRERMQQNMSTQELLVGIRQEILSTTKLPMALDFMSVELQHTGGFATAMERISHYFTAFQAFVIREAEKDRGRFDFRVALEILQKEAEYRSATASPQGIFLYQFEVLCRNRLGYDRGLRALAEDPMYDENWKEWIRSIPRRIGLLDIADLIFVRSEHYRQIYGEMDQPALFGEKEGKIALANRRRDPLFLFSAFARHLGYPPVPRPSREQSDDESVYALRRRLERLEARLRLLEEESHGGINLKRYVVSDKKPGRPPGVPPECGDCG